MTGRQVPHTFTSGGAQVLGLFVKELPTNSADEAKSGADFRNQVLGTLESPPPEGQAMWDGASVAKVVQGSKHAVWRVLRKEGICLQRQRSWCVSTDKEFAAKAADIVGLYLDPPHNALVICVQQFPLCPEPKETRGAQHSGFANFAPFYGDYKLATV